jgi:hypothetical protein
MSAHHEKQQTNLHNLQATKHKKYRKKGKEEKYNPPYVHDCQPSPSLAFFANHIQHSKSSIRASLPYIIQLGLNYTIKFVDIGLGHMCHHSIFKNLCLHRFFHQDIVCGISIGRFLPVPNVSHPNPLLCKSYFLHPALDIPFHPCNLQKRMVPPNYQPDFFFCLVYAF